MDYQVVTEKEKKVIGIACHTSNEPGRAEKDIPHLWQTFSQEKIFECIPDKISQEILAVYSDYEKDYTAPYSCLIGCEVKGFEHVPTGFSIKTLPLSKYAVFNITGPYPHSLIEAWKWIWNSSLKRTYTGDFELYPPHFFNNPEKGGLKLYLSIY